MTQGLYLKKRKLLQRYSKAVRLMEEIFIGHKHLDPQFKSQEIVEEIVGEAVRRSVLNNGDTKSGQIVGAGHDTYLESGGRTAFTAYTDTDRYSSVEIDFGGRAR